jgi:hypothetical protein
MDRMFVRFMAVVGFVYFCASVGRLLKQWLT